jgi:PelA/Pel-15E family pectate lyase
MMLASPAETLRPELCLNSNVMRILRIPDWIIGCSCLLLAGSSGPLPSPTGAAAHAAPPAAKAIPLTGASLHRKPDAWFTGDEAKAVLARISTYQTPAGGWCKGYDATAARDPAGDKASYGDWGGMPTIDNGATVAEIRLFARAFALTEELEYRETCLRGVDFLLQRQYPNGGWPQRSPLDGHRGYGARITFNDNAMVNVLELLRAIAAGQAPFSFVDAAHRAQASQAFDRGVQCIVNCQIKVNGRLTAWCAQHDEVSLAPAGARAYELPSISGGESAQLAKLLMSLDAPNARVRQSIAAAAAWFESVKITGQRIAVVDAPGTPQGKDKVMVQDPAAPPLWARFYDLDTNRPIFCSRDGIKRFALTEISYERRNGYAWHGTWGNEVLKGYSRWKPKCDPTAR